MGVVIRLLCIELFAHARTKELGEKLNETILAEQEFCRESTHVCSQISYEI